MRLQGNFKQYIPAFEEKLEHIVPADISSEPYCRNYLTHLLWHKKYFLTIYADVLYKLARHSPLSKADTILIDYGSGSGLLGIFAKFCGFKKVFLIDLDARFIHASEKLSRQMDIKLDGYLTGDISSAQAYFKIEAPDAIIGTDVIEHIYNLEGFFATLRQMNPSIVSVFTTASNPNNFYKVSQLKKLQLKDELVGGTPGDHILYGEIAQEPFLRIRAGIIREYNENLAEVEILDLAEATRGMNEQDIVAAVVQYNVSGKLPVPPVFKTNTCNPLNGSWTERVLSLKEFNRLYRSAGLELTCYNGFYNAYETGFKKYIKKMLNTCIAVLGNKIAPYILIVGWRNKKPG